MKCLLSFSGGLDSTCLLSELLKEKEEVFPVIFSYGSKHNKYEIEAARKICAYYSLTPYFFELSSLFYHFKSDLLLSGDEIPEGHYTDANMSKTVVPSRNFIFISILTGLAESLKMDRVALGVHQGDHTIYPDCRPAFIRAVSQASYFASDGKVQIYTPFLYYTKGEIVKKGIKNKAPITLTRTCYKDQEMPCGKCGACVERQEALEENEIGEK